MTHSSYRYPTHLIDVAQLADGSRVVIRPALPQDSDLQRAFLRNLSDEARYFCFMTRLSELPEAMAERFSAIDYQSHVALIAEISTDAGGIMIAEARYIVDEREPTACEFAAAVADDCRGMGLARILLERCLATLRAPESAACQLEKVVVLWPSRKSILSMMKRSSLSVEVPHCCSATPLSAMVS